MGKDAVLGDLARSFPLFVLIGLCSLNFLFWVLPLLELLGSLVN